jgi:hypothetical protein
MPNVRTLCAGECYEKVWGGTSSCPAERQEAAAKLFSSAEGPYIAGTGILFMRK